MFPILDPHAAGAVLRGLRQSRGLTQAELGRRLGVSKGRISAIERDPAGVSLAQIQHIATILGARLVLDDRSASHEATSDAEW
ncbi:MAG: helix-turn-helix domain-containing protein [Gemmatimonadaceae bacterium]|jgi:HTH-type transcriptional regulator/antitoxin HipB|nr:helix-turn-helix domain-containing protein [Gemmatimonadaceae bacterium]